MSTTTLSIKKALAVLTVAGGATLAVKLGATSSLATSVMAASGVPKLGSLAAGATSAGAIATKVGSLVGEILLDDDTIPMKYAGEYEMNPALRSDTKTLTIEGDDAEAALDFIKTTSISSGMSLAEFGAAATLADRFQLSSYAGAATGLWHTMKASPAPSLATKHGARAHARTSSLATTAIKSTANIGAVASFELAEADSDLIAHGSALDLDHRDDFLAINDSWTSLNPPILVFGAKMIAYGYKGTLMAALEEVDATITLAEGLSEPVFVAKPASGEIPTCIPTGPFVDYLNCDPGYDGCVADYDFGGYTTYTAEYSGYAAPPSSSSSCEGRAYKPDCDSCGSTTATNDEGLSYNEALNVLEAHMEDVLGLSKGDIGGEWWGWFEDSDGRESDDVEDLTARLAFAFMARNTASVIYCGDPGSSRRDEGAVVFEMVVKRTGTRSWSDMEDLADPEDGGYDVDSAEYWIDEAGVTLEATSMSIRDHAGVRTLTGDALNAYLSTCTESLIDP